jgi:hypothetical protein
VSAVEGELDAGGERDEIFDAIAPTAMSRIETEPPSTARLRLRTWLQ